MGVILIALAGISMGLYDSFQKIASKYLPAFVVSLISSSVVMAISILLILAGAKSGLKVNLTKEGIVAAVAVGLAATGIEIFGVWAYSKGLPLISGALITTAVPVITASLFALIFLGESLSVYKIIGAFFIIFGIIVVNKG